MGIQGVEVVPSKITYRNWKNCKHGFYEEYPLRG